MNQSKTATPGVVLINRDPQGNSLIFKRFKTGNCTLELNLLSEKRARLLGNIDAEAQTLFITRNRAKHLHVKSNSYGLNDFILRNPPVTVKDVTITDEVGRYNIPVTAILTQGKYLFFNKSGFEKQIFIPIELLERYAVE